MSRDTALQLFNRLGVDVGSLVKPQLHTEFHEGATRVVVKCSESKVAYVLDVMVLGPFPADTVREMV